MAFLVNGELIDDTALREERRALRRALAERLPEASAPEIEGRAREWAGENLIDRLLLKQAALRDPAPIPDETISEVLKLVQNKLRDQPAGAEPRSDADLRRDIEMRLRIERFLATITASVARPRRKDIVEYYKKNRAAFHGPEQVHAAHIIKHVGEQHTEDEVRTAMEQIQLTLRNGTAFETLADELSDSPGRSGDLDYFSRGQMVPEFEAVAFSLAPGEVSDIFRTPFGFHIVKVYDHRAEGLLPLEAVSAKIEEYLFVQKKQKVLDQYTDSLRAKAVIEEVKQPRA
jgi:peptidyl-prolyl cis-trans isomerase C